MKVVLRGSREGIHKTTYVFIHHDNTMQISHCNIYSCRHTFFEPHLTSSSHYLFHKLSRQGVKAKKHRPSIKKQPIIMMLSTSPDSKGVAKQLEPFVCGGAAATFASVIIHPIDLAKVCVVWAYAVCGLSDHGRFLYTLRGNLGARLT